MAAQQHVVWFDLTSSCNLSKFLEEMKSKIIWGREQQVIVWGLDKETAGEWKVTTDDQFRDMIEARWDEKEMSVCCEVVARDKDSSRMGTWDSEKANVPKEQSVHGTSGVTAEHLHAHVHRGNVECTDDACSSPELVPFIDWGDFTILPDEELDGSVVEIATVKVGNKVHFSRFFCAFKASIDGFLQGCRPYISIDSTALNGQWNGHMPAANAIDGHNWMFPIAFGFFDSETKENWIWFMEQLGKALGSVDKLAICTDACKGLEAAVKKVFPMAEQRECFRHLMENLKKRFNQGKSSGSLLGQYMWPAARAYTEEKYQRLMDKVVAGSSDIVPWLDEHHSLLWARSKFSTEIKCDYINNNLAESWNNWIKELKDMPLDSMADAIRIKTLVMWEKRRKISSSMSGNILPAVIHQLNAASKGLDHLKVTKGNTTAEVTVWFKGEEVKRHVVYLEEQECTCREWQVTGKPCSHALAVITTERQPDMGKYVHEYYSVRKLQAAYAGQIPNLTDKQQWPVVDKGFKVFPPVAKTKRPPGRQRKNRILGCLERTGKATRQVTCKKCGELGHRAGTWKCPQSGIKKRPRNKKVGRPKKVVTEEEEPASKKKKTAEDELIQAASPRTPATTVAAPMEIVPRTPRTRSVARNEAAALEEAAAKQQASTTASRKRRLELDEPMPLEIVQAHEDEARPPTKKMTPRKKQLATKVKKTPAKAGN